MRATAAAADHVAAVTARIAAARVTTQPFPHIVVDDLLPAEVRATIDRWWPDRERMRTTNFAGRGEMLVSRLAREAPSREAFEAWSGLRAIGAAAATAARLRLQRYFHDKFRPLAGIDWRRRIRDVVWQESDAMIAHYTGVLKLLPHIDHARVAVNGFVYLDDPDQPTPEPRRGTMLYRSHGFAWPSNMSVPEQLRHRFLREARDVDWQDNRLLAYVNGPWSFHGVPSHDLGDSRRRLLMFGSVIDAATADTLFGDETV